MKKLTNEMIKNNISHLLCTYGEDAWPQLTTGREYSPETFTAYDKLNQRNLIHFANVSFEEWIKNMIIDQLKSIDTGDNDTPELVNTIYNNVVNLLDYQHNGYKVGEKIYNQEFVDTIRNIMAFTIYGTFDRPIMSSEYFNNLAASILPEIIKYFRDKDYDLKELLVVSIASGLSGLDLKGSPAASSRYSTFGIPMAHYIELPKEEAVSTYIEELSKIVATSARPIFHWDTLLSKIKTSKKMCWMTDDYIESHFDLLIIENILDNYDITVEIIPKNGFYGNDLSWQDLEKIIASNLYPKLTDYLRKGKFIINKQGPKMGAANIAKLSDESVKSICDADFIIAKGCRIHELTQGNINCDAFYSYIVCRELSESSTGLSSHNRPIIFHFLQKGMYSFWGIDKGCSKTVVSVNGGKEITAYYSTLVDYERRIQLTDPKKIVEEISELLSFYPEYKGTKRPLISTLSMLNNKLMDVLESK